jgi:hypothetical protein
MAARGKEIIAAMAAMFAESSKSPSSSALSTGCSTWGHCKGDCLGRIANNPTLSANCLRGGKDTQTSCDPTRRFLALSGDLQIRLPGALQNRWWCESGAGHSDGEWARLNYVNLRLMTE